MKRLAQLLGPSLRVMANAVASLLLWTVWLGLILLAAAQIYIASTNELAVPAFLLRAFEARIAQSGLRVTFERTTLDPTGRLLVQQPRVFVPGFADPVVTARAAYVGFNPWAVALGRFEPREIRLLEGTVAVPAMLSPSGRPEPIVRDVDALIATGANQLNLRHVSARVSGLLVSLHGTVASTPRAGRSPEELAGLVRARFAEFCRGAVEFTRRLEAFDEPSLDLELTLSPSRGAMVNTELTARGCKLDRPFAMQLGRFRATTRFPLLGDPLSSSTLDFVADELKLPNAIAARHVAATLRGRLHQAQLRVEPDEIQISTDALTLPEGVVEAASATLHPKSLTQWSGDAVARVLGVPMSLSGEADLSAKTAEVRVAGAVAPAVVDAISTRVHVDVRKFFVFERARILESDAQFGPEWKFRHLTARVTVGGMNAHGVRLDEGAATIDLTPQRLYSPDAYVRLGDNFAGGSYEHVFATRAFRFLLDGRLRPLDISGWFREWWPKFFERFDFTAAPPDASVDVTGIWREGRRSSIFVFADAKAPVILKQKLQRVRTRLFIRPGFYDGLEVLAIDPAGGTARGTFTLAVDLDAGAWRSFDVDAESTVALGVASGMASQLGQSLLAPFSTVNAPAVKLRGHFDGPGVNARHRTMELIARTAGEFRYHDLPLQDVSFLLRLHDDEIAVDNVDAKFAGGGLKGHAKVWGPASERRIGFDGAVTDASLGIGVAALQDYVANRKGQPRPSPGKFMKEKANVRIDVAASAEGLYGNALSFHGNGNTVLRGPEIGEVPLFGPLSDLLKFTALRFTSARSSFKISGPKLEFPDVALRGANSAIDAHGDYWLDRRELDFRAKVFPFQESGSVIKSVVGVVLTPISNALEVKLTGSLEKPDWAFVIGPTNLFRSLAPTPAATADASQPAAPETKPMPVSPPAGQALPDAPNPERAPAPKVN